MDADSALIDSKNLPGFDTDRLEGVIEKPLGRASFWGLFAAFILLIIFFTYRSYGYQIVKGDEYLKKSIANFSRSGILFAERGVVFDRNGRELI